MSSATNLQLEIFWQGLLTYSSFTIEGVNIKIQKSAYKLYANLNTDFTQTQHQPLSITLINKKNSTSTNHRKVNIPVTLASTMQISVVMFERCENPFMRTRQADGKFHTASYLSRSKHPIQIEEVPSLRAGEKYRLIIANQNNELQAILTQKVDGVRVHVLSEGKTSPEQTKRELEARLHISCQKLNASVNQALHALPSNNTLQTQRSLHEQEDDGHEFARLSQLVERCELEQSQTSRRIQRIKTNIVEAETDLQKAETNYTTSLTSNNPSQIQDASIRKNFALKRLTKLRDDLELLESHT